MIIVLRFSAAEIPEPKASSDRFKGLCRLRSALGRVFAHDAVRFTEGDVLATDRLFNFAD
jgi:hypothetical protein